VASSSQDRRISQYGARDGDPLALASRQPDTALAQKRIEALRQGLQKVARGGGLSRHDDLLIAGLGPPVANVFPSIGRKDDRLLRDQSDARAQRRRVHQAQIDAVERDPAALRVVKPQQELKERRFARARRADDRQMFARLDREVDTVEG